MPYKDPEFAKKKAHENYLKNREKVLAWQKKYVATHREQTRQAHRAWDAKNREKLKAYYAEWRSRNRDKCRLKNRAYKQRLQDECYAAYGNRCACCGDDHREFFSIDHIHGNGNSHRRKEKLTTTTDTYLWLKRRGWPKEFRILCYNCNCARGFFGYCPHERQSEYGIGIAC